MPKMKENEQYNTLMDAPLAPRRSRGQEFWRVFRQNNLAIAGLAVFFLFFFFAVMGLITTSGTTPILDPTMIRLQEKLLPPLAQANLVTLRAEEVPAMGLYLLGTDELGRDVFSRMLQGAWVSLTVGFVAVGISVVIGIFLGGIAGYYGDRRITIGQVLGICLIGAGMVMLGMKSFLVGIVLCTTGMVLVAILLWRTKVGDSEKEVVHIRILERETFSVDTCIMRLVDIMLCFPSFFLILTVVALLPASIYNIMVVIGLTSWMGTTRFVRAEFLSLREQDFVTAARALGVGNFRIIFRHMMPNAVAPVLVSATIGIATAILTEAGLSFLGFGVPPPHATWGNILSDGKGYIFDAPWLTFVPGVAILIVVLSFNLFGEGLRDALNPKLRES